MKAPGTMDPLLYPSLELEPSEMAELTSGHDILSHLDSMITEKKAIEDVLLAPKPVGDFFERVFPEVAESNSVGKLTPESWSHWKTGTNEVTLEEDPRPLDQMLNSHQGRDLYIGGPAALFSAALQSRSGQDPHKVLFCHDSKRGTSNWKGSASYFHIRDCIPVYYWPDNHGAYVLWITAAHWLKRWLDPKGYKKELETEQNWNNLRLDVPALFKEPATVWLFMKNTFNAWKDVGLSMDRSKVGGAVEDKTAWTTTDHAFLSHQIIEKLDAPKPVIMKSDMGLGAALHLHLGDNGLDEENNVIGHLSKVAGDLIRHRRVSEQELTARGYNTDYVKQALEFQHDGYMPPYVDGMLEQMVKDEGGNSRGGLRLRKILVVQKDDDIHVTRAVFENLVTGSEETVDVRSLYMSLGPSMRTLKVLPTNSSVTKNMMQHMMWASGSSIIVMVRVDKEKVADHKMTKFRDHIGAHNKHLVRLAEREVVSGGRRFQVFAMQTTGGGHFPMKNAHAETAVNILKANCVPTLGLDSEDGIEWDVISVRSCARGVTAQNVFRMAAPASNMVMMYGIGGIGMTTMAPNALLMKAVMGARQELSRGDISNQEFAQKLRESNFSQIPHWNAPNPFSRNYSLFMDNVNNPQLLTKYFRRASKALRFIPA